MKLVRHAENECQAWFNANETVIPLPQEYSIEEPQILILGNICMVDGSWTSTSPFSGWGWAWMDSLGKVQLIETRNYRRRESALHSGKHYLGHWRVCSSIRHVRTLVRTARIFDRDDKWTSCLVKFCNWTGEDKDFADKLSRYQDHLFS